MNNLNLVLLSAGLIGIGLLTFIAYDFIRGIKDVYTKKGLKEAVARMDKIEDIDTSQVKTFSIDYIDEMKSEQDTKKKGDMLEIFLQDVFLSFDGVDALIGKQFIDREKRRGNPIVAKKANDHGLDLLIIDENNRIKLYKETQNDDGSILKEVVGDRPTFTIIQAKCYGGGSTIERDILDKLLKTEKFIATILDYPIDYRCIITTTSRIDPVCEKESQGCQVKIFDYKDFRELIQDVNNTRDINESFYSKFVF